MEPVKEVADPAAPSYDEDSTTVTLIVGDTVFVAHRAVLAAGSPVFATMLDNGWLEDGSGQVIGDVEVPVLCQLLDYLYTLEDPLVPTDVPQLLAAADNYGVLGLKAYCEWHTIAQLTVENAAAAAVLAIRHSCPRLEQAVITFIRGHFQVLTTRGWADAVCTAPEDAAEVVRLLTEMATETSAPRMGCSRSTTGTRTQPRRCRDWRTRPPCDATISRLRQSPPIQQCYLWPPAPCTNMLSHGASLCSAPPTGGSRRTTSTRTPPRKDRDRRTRPPCDATISRLRRLSKQERGRMLIEAAVVGAVEMIRMLLVAGVDVKARDNCGMTALHWAAVTGHVEVVRCLLRNGAEVGSKDSEQRTPLHLAAMAGHAAVVRLLMVPTPGSDAGCQYRAMPLRANADGLADVGAVSHQAGNYRRVQN